MDASFANKVTIFLWFMALTFCPSAWVEAGCSEEQNRALLEIRNSSNGLLFAHFDGSRDCCLVSNNIACDDDGKVTDIYLLDRMKAPSIFTWYPNVTLFTLFNELEVLDLMSMNIGGELQVRQYPLLVSELAKEADALLNEGIPHEDQDIISVHERLLRANTKDYGRYDPTPALVKPPFKLIPN